MREAFESAPANARMFSLARRLKSKYSLGIITDNKKDRVDHLKKSQGLAQLFDPIVVSAEVGSSKKGSAIFRKAAGDVGFAPEACVFIDNDATNLVAARSLGMKTIFHDDEKNDIEALAAALGALGVVIDMPRNLSSHIKP